FAGLAVFAAANMVLSVDHGSGHLLTERLLSGTSSVRARVDLIAVTGIAASAAITFATATAAPVRLAIAAWAVLQVATFLPAEPPRTLLALAAYAAALLGYLYWTSGQRGAAIVPRSAAADATRLTASI